MDLEKSKRSVSSSMIPPLCKPDTSDTMEPTAITDMPVECPDVCTGARTGGRGATFDAPTDARITTDG